MKRLSLFLFASALLCLLCVAGLTPPAAAQDTEQDFEATFFPDPRIEPPVGPPPDFRFDRFNGNPEGSVMAGGWDGQFARLISAVNNQRNALSFNQEHTGDWGTGLEIEFDMRISPGNAGGADGLSVLYMPSATFDADTFTAAPDLGGTPEEGNLAGSLGVSFDTWDSGAVDGGDGAQDGISDSSISLHFDGVLVGNVVLDPPVDPLAIPVLETGDVLNVTITAVPDGGGGSDVTVEVTDGIDTIIPYDGVNIPGLVPYDGRLLFEGRTGGANQDFDFDNISLSVNGSQELSEDFESVVIPPPPTVRFDQYSTDPPGQVLSDTEGWDGQFARVGNAVANQQNVMSFPEVHSGPYDSMLIEFDFRFTPGGADGADGFGLAYLSSADYGVDTTTPAPWFSEEANLLNTFGVGFDIWDNGVDDGGDGAQDGVADNSISLHFNGLLVANVALDGAVPLDISVLDDGTVLRASILVEGDLVSVELEDIDPASPNFGVVVPVFIQEPVPGLSDYDGRLAFSARTGGANADQDADNVRLTINGVDVKLDEDFEGFEVIEPPVIIPPEPTGGTPFTLVNFGATPEATIWPDDGELIPADGAATVKPGFLRLNHEVAGHIAICAFDQTSSDVGTITATFKFRGAEDTPGNLGRADGVSYLLIPVATYEATGANLIGNFNPMEEPNLPGAFGVGFDTYNSGAVDGNSNNTVSLHWDGLLIANEVLNPGEIDLVNGEFNEVTVEVYQVADGYNATVSIVDGTDSSEHVIFQDVAIPGMNLDPTALGEGARVLFAGRTGGQADNYEFDDLLVTYSTDTKPADVARSFAAPVHFTGDPVEVGLLVDDLQTGDAAFDITIEETLPAGWTAEDITAPGSFAGGVVSWSLTGVDMDTALEYTAVPPDPDLEDPVVFSGTYTVAGESRGIGGESSLAVLPVPFPRGAGAPFLSDDFDEHLVESECPDGWTCNGGGGTGLAAWFPGVTQEAGFEGRLRVAKDKVVNPGIAATVIWNTELDLTQNSFIAEFDVFLSNLPDPVDDIPADGMTFMVLDADVSTTADVGGAGGLLGYGGLSGFAVELDIYQGADDPSGYNTNFYGHMGVIRDGTVTPHVQTNVDFNPDLVPTFAGGTGWPEFVDQVTTGIPLTVKVDYNNGRIQVWLSAEATGAEPEFDAVKVLDTYVTFPGKPGSVLQRAWIGFSAATGGSNANHEVDDVEITIFDKDDVAPVEICDNDLDDDGDGDVDCDDDDCVDAENCLGGGYIRGDDNADGAVNITDAIYLLSSLFLGGPPPPCSEAADNNGDGAVNITDAIYLLSSLFLGGPPPPAPNSCQEVVPAVLPCTSFPPCEA